MSRSRSTWRSPTGLCRLLAALAVVSLLAAACGDDEDAAPEPAPAPAEETPAETPAEAPAEEAAAAETPAETPAEEAPAEEAPAEAPAEEAPAEEAPAEVPAEAGGILEDALVCFSNPTAGNSYMQAIQDGAEAALAAAGVEMTAVMANLDPNKQVADIDECIAKGSHVIMVPAPLVTEAILPPLQRAVDAGIATIGLDIEFYYDGTPPTSPVQAQVVEDRKLAAEQQAAFLNEAFGGEGQVVFIGFVFPVALIEESANQFAAALDAYPGLELVDRVDNPTDDAAGARPLIDDVLTRLADVDAIVAYNGASAAGAAAAVAAAGRSDEIVVLGLQTQPEALPGLGDGSVAADWDFEPVAAGQRMAELALAALSGASDAEWQITVLTDVVKYDASNIADFVSWEDQIDAIG